MLCDSRPARGPVAVRTSLTKVNQFMRRIVIILFMLCVRFQLFLQFLVIIRLLEMSSLIMELEKQLRVARSELKNIR